MAMVNPIINPLQVKDSRWLTLEVCREYQRNKCTRPETECKFAHPPPHVEVQNGRVTCCFDSIKGKCQRKDPPCKYLHPPQHLREQLLQNGRNNLIIKNLQMQALAAGMQPLLPGVVPAVMYEGGTTSGKGGMAYSASTATPNATATSMLPGHYPILAHPYLTAASNIPTYPFINHGLPMTSVIQSVDPNNTPTMSGTGGQVHNVLNNVGQSAKRSDRLEVCREFQRGTCTRQPNECRYAHPPDSVALDSADSHVTVCMDFVKGKCSREACRYFHPPPHLQGQIKAQQQRPNATSVTTAAPSTLPSVVEVLTATGGKKRPREPSDDYILGMSTMPGMVPMVKRPAVADSKSGIPMYQPTTTNTAAYQQAALAMQLQQAPYVPVTLAGHPPGVPRF